MIVFWNQTPGLQKQTYESQVSISSYKVKLCEMEADGFART